MLPSSHFVHAYHGSGRNSVPFPHGQLYGLCFACHCIANPELSIHERRFGKILSILPHATPLHARTPPAASTANSSVRGNSKDTAIALVGGGKRTLSTQLVDVSSSAAAPPEEGSYSISSDLMGLFTLPHVQHSSFLCNQRTRTTNALTVSSGEPTHGGYFFRTFPLRELSRPVAWTTEANRLIGGCPWSHGASSELRQG